MRAAAVLILLLVSGCGRSSPAASARTTPLPRVVPVPTAPPPPVANARPRALGCPADERHDNAGGCWPARTLRPEIDGASCSWQVAALQSRLPTRELDVGDAPAKLVLVENRMLARVEAPLRFDSEVSEVHLRTVRALDVAQGTAALGAGAAVVGPRLQHDGTVIASVVVGEGARLLNVTMPCDALGPGPEVGGDEGDPERPHGRTIALPPRPFQLRTAPDAPPALAVSTYSRGLRAALLSTRGPAREIEWRFTGGHVLRGWALAADLAPPPPRRPVSRRQLTKILGDLSQTPQGGVVDVLSGSVQGLGPVLTGGGGTGMDTSGLGGIGVLGHGSGSGTGARAPDPCLFVPRMEGELRTARVAREAPVLRGRVGRHVWAEIATDDPIELFIPTEGDRARIVRLPGLTPVRSGRRCPNVFLDAWVPKSALLEL